MNLLMMCVLAAFAIGVDCGCDNVMSPCAAVLCGPGSTCVANPETCDAECIPIEPVCNNEVDPCTLTDCATGLRCVTNPATCEAECIPIEPVCNNEVDPCTLTDCATGLRCVTNPATCEAECISIKPACNIPIRGPIRKTDPCAVVRCAGGRCIVEKGRAKCVPAITAV